MSGFSLRTKPRTHTRLSGPSGSGPTSSSPRPGSLSHSHPTSNARLVPASEAPPCWPSAWHALPNPARSVAGSASRPCTLPVLVPSTGGCPADSPVLYRPAPACRPLASLFQCPGPGPLQSHFSASWFAQYSLPPSRTETAGGQGSDHLCCS